MEYWHFLREGYRYSVPKTDEPKVKIINWEDDNRIILSEDSFYPLNPFESKVNNNVLVVGPSGSGKTRSIVSPNILQAVGSYVISDPKGNLYKKYSLYLQERGYNVLKLDFTNPKDSVHYNPLQYIHNSKDIQEIAHMLLYSNEKQSHSTEPYWDMSAQELLTAFIAYLIEFTPKKYHTLENVMRLATNCKVLDGVESRREPSLTMQLFESAEDEKPNSFAVRKFKQVMLGATKTIQSILITLTMRLGAFDFPDINEMMAYDQIGLSSIGDRKTALFVIVSDTDRSMDNLANLFFTQALHELCNHADNDCPNQALPIHTRFIMDDFATNVQINDFPRMISSFRSRNISCMLMIQAEAQLKHLYDYDAATVIGNCDTYIYLGGNDIETATNVSIRVDIPVKNILDMEIGTNWICRRGEKPKLSHNFDLNKYEEFRKITYNEFIR